MVVLVVLVVRAGSAVQEGVAAAEVGVLATEEHHLAEAVMGTPMLVGRQVRGKMQERAVMAVVLEILVKQERMDHRLEGVLVVQQEQPEQLERPDRLALKAIA
mgnify:CR=1 FL=1